MPANLATPVGLQNGVNVNFATPTPYAVGSLTVRLNLANLIASQVVEIDPSNGLFTIAQAPNPLDILVCAYNDPPPVPDGSLQLLPSTAFLSQLAALSNQGGNDFIFRAGQSGPLILIYVFDSTGSPYNLTGSVLYFRAAQDSEAGTIVFDKTSSGPTPPIVILDQSQEATIGQAQVTFTSNEVLAAAAQPGQFLVYDVWIKTPAPALQIVPLTQDGRIEVRPSIRTSFP